MSQLSASTAKESKPFRASFLKIERARQHIAELEKTAAGFLAGNPVKSSIAIDPGIDSRMPIVAFKFKIDPVPEIVSSILGDIFHNLRSSLDLMASELCRNQKKSDEGVYFPFCDNESELDAMIKRRHFDRTGDASVRLLKELKPYKGGNITLRAIHDLNVQDKHQRLIANAVSFSSPIIDLRPTDDQIGPVVVGDPSTAKDVKIMSPAGSPLADRELIPTLHELVELTTSIVESFKALAAPAD